ncbi:MAG: recombinase family protein [Candidatus Cloacimonetes bacterium]|nr:recombinase family protein [Candidatus Cloacimonadota bacterium]
MIFGYARVSTHDQNLDRQLEDLNKIGVDEVFQEKVTGTKADRPQLNRLFEKLRKDDVVIVSDLTRLSRSTKDLFNLVELIQSKGANIKSIKESWLDTTTPTGKLMFTFIAGISQFERDLISQRTKEGLEIARARGKVGGRKQKLDNVKKETIHKLYQEKNMSVMDICKMFSISKPTLYKVINEVSNSLSDILK